MTKLEDDIRKALLDSGSPDEINQLLEEKSFIQELGALFRGRNTWPTYVTYIGIVVMLAIGVWGIVRLLEADSAREIAGYALIINFAFLVVLMNKLWLWMQLNKNAAVREILRLELRIQEIQKRLKNKT
jgi:Family of unknown function (DUF6768)